MIIREGGDPGGVPVVFHHGTPASRHSAGLAYLDGAPVDDLRWLDDEKRRIWASDLREATASLDGYARDNVAWGAEWDIDITAVRCPVRIYHGANDKLVPPKHGRWLADRIAGAEFVSRPGAGHGTTSYGDWDFIFGPLRSALR